jgi:hypothetical protein
MWRTPTTRFLTIESTEISFEPNPGNDDAKMAMPGLKGRVSREEYFYNQDNLTKKLGKLADVGKLSKDANSIREDRNSRNASNSREASNLGGKPATVFRDASIKKDTSCGNAKRSKK